MSFPGWNHPREYPDEPEAKYYSKPNIDEGIARYRLAAVLAHGLEVLDVACGSGYGPVLLADVAKRVVGVDKDPDAITYCKMHYSPRENLAFKVMDGRQLAFPPLSFDYVVQHGMMQYDEPPRQHEALSEIVKVLRPNGFTMVSVNYNVYYGPDLTKAHPYHIWAFDHVGLGAILHHHFYFHRVFVQHGRGFHLDPHRPGTTWIAVASNDREKFREIDAKLEPHYSGRLSF